ncbi:XrtB/PEP-CTERM-associated polysaccharide biosynthesis outer membrane protein EpsL [Massilia sp. TWP1-3-3]|uniref:XrtB/PEP-CTERM-associated polysaccharide biosynthesis outer membrane protein EpsL n=1 Tax=Massilia sp. TWP1-3-3 TaxID=2804573 RepID=UPI003CFACB9E
MATISRLHPGPGPAFAPGLAPLVLPLLLLAFAGGAAAQQRPETPPGPLGGFHLVASAGAFHDDNLFRIPGDRPAFDNQRSDWARYLIGGLLFDKAYGRQKVYLQGKVSSVKFDHFKQIDYNGKDMLGLLDWQLGNRLEGSLGASYAETLAPYTDIRTRERNLREHRRGHADGAWRMHPQWRLRVAAARDKYSYQIPIQQVNDRTEDALEAGLDFTPRSGSTAGVVVRRVKGRYPNPRSISGMLVNDDFTQDELKAKVHWNVTGASSVNVLAGYARRRHELLGQRDAKGFNGRVTASLNPRQKLRLNAAAWREFAAVESDLVSYSLNRGASAGASWDASAKVRVDASLSSERRRYQGGFLSALQGQARDRLRNAALGVTWSPRSTLQLNANYAHQRRSGAVFLGNGSFKANTFSVSASAQF